MKMNKPRVKCLSFFVRIKSLEKRIRRFVFIIVAAFILGFTNVFYEELRWINDAKNHEEHVQVSEDGET